MVLRRVFPKSFHSPKSSTSFMNQFDVFMSYNGDDRPLVTELVSLLEEKGVSVWFDQDDLTAGVAWIPELENSIKKSAVFVAVLGESGIGPWQQPEIEAALMESVERQVPVVPLLLPGGPQDAKLPSFLSRFTWVDFRSGFDSAGMNRLLKSVDLGRSLFNEASPTPASKTKKTNKILQVFSRSSTDTIEHKLATWLPVIAALLLVLLASPPVFSDSWYQNTFTSLLMSAALVGAGFGIARFFFNGRPSSVNRTLFIVAVLFTVSLLSYLILVWGFTELRPDSGTRQLTGRFSKSFYEVLEFNNDDYYRTKNDFEFDPERIYTSSSRFYLFVACISALFTMSIFSGAMAAGIQRMLGRKETPSTSALVLLDLPSKIRTQLHQINIETVGDLVSTSRSQLLQSESLEGSELEEVEEALAAVGLQLRERI